MSTWRPQEAASLVIDICRFTSDTLQTFSFRIGSKCSQSHRQLHRLFAEQHTAQQIVSADWR